MALFLGVALTACTAPQGGALPNKPGATAVGTTAKVITGRLGLQFIDGPMTSIQLGFSLQGDRTEGQLVLETPFGTTLGSAQWNANGALLNRGQAQQQFATLDALLQQELGGDLPLDGLFAWIQKQSTAELSAAGWVVEDTQDPNRLRAARAAPPPAVRLTLLLDPRP